MHVDREPGPGLESKPVAFSTFKSFSKAVLGKKETEEKKKPESELGFW